jgi:hypothetical protein
MNESKSQVLLYPPERAPHALRMIVGTVMAIGAIAFIAGMLVSPQRAWQSYFVNFLFWSGIAQGGVVMAAVYRITNARWGEQFRRIGEGMIGFLPVSLLLFLLLLAGGNHLFPWFSHVIHGKELWLNPYFVFSRDGVAFIVLLMISYRFVYHSVRPDIGFLNEQGLVPDRRVLFVVKEWKGWPEESAKAAAKLAKLTPVLLICFGMLYSMIGFDLVMGLDPEWYSTLFGWLYSLHAFFAALTVITILAYFSTRWFNVKDAFVTHQWHDMGRFVFGFALLSGGFYWSQYLVIWYGNLPEESSYLIKRFYSQPWEPLMWVYIILAYLFPLVVFLSARIKQIPAALSVVAGLILAALFLERFIAVIPFVWAPLTVPFGLLEICITLGFAALFLRCWLAFARWVPIVPPGSPAKPFEASHEKGPSMAT